MKWKTNRAILRYTNCQQAERAATYSVLKKNVLRFLSAQTKHTDTHKCTQSLAAYFFSQFRFFPRNEVTQSVGWHFPCESIECQLLGVNCCCCCCYWLGLWCVLVWPGTLEFCLRHFFGVLHFPFTVALEFSVLVFFVIAFWVFFVYSVFFLLFICLAQSFGFLFHFWLCAA